MITDNSTFIIIYVIKAYVDKYDWTECPGHFACQAALYTFTSI